MSACASRVAAAQRLGLVDAVDGLGDEEDVDVGDVVELAPAALAEREDGEPAARRRRPGARRARSRARASSVASARSASAAETSTNDAPSAMSAAAIGEQPAPVGRRAARATSRPRRPAPPGVADARVGPDRVQQLGAHRPRRREQRRRRAVAVGVGATQHDPVLGVAHEVVAERRGRAEHGVRPRPQVGVGVDARATNCAAPRACVSATRDSVASARSGSGASARSSTAASPSATRPGSLSSRHRAPASAKPSRARRPCRLPARAAGPPRRHVMLSARRRARRRRRRGRRGATRPRISVAAVDHLVDARAGVVARTSDRAGVVGEPRAEDLGVDLGVELQRPRAVAEAVGLDAGSPALDASSTAPSGSLEPSRRRGTARQVRRRAARRSSGSLGRGRRAVRARRPPDLGRPARARRRPPQARVITCPPRHTPRTGTPASTAPTTSSRSGGQPRRDGGPPTRPSRRRARRGRRTPAGSEVGTGSPASASDDDDLDADLAPTTRRAAPGVGRVVAGRRAGARAPGRCRAPWPTGPAGSARARTASTCAAVLLPLGALVAQEEVEDVLAEGLGDAARCAPSTATRLAERARQRLDAERAALGLGERPDVVLGARRQLVALLDALEPGREHDGEREVGVGRGVDRAELDAGGVALGRLVHRDADQRRAVVVAPADVRRCLAAAARAACSC